MESTQDSSLQGSSRLLVVSIPCSFSLPSVDRTSSIGLPVLLLCLFDIVLRRTRVSLEASLLGMMGEDAGLLIITYVVAYYVLLLVII